MKNKFMKFNDRLKAELRKFVQWDAPAESVKDELREAMQLIEVLTQAIENDESQAVIMSGISLQVMFSRMSEAAHSAYGYCESVVADEMGLDSDGFIG